MLSWYHRENVMCVLLLMETIRWSLVRCCSFQPAVLMCELRVLTSSLRAFA